jgi:hypothetical protein
MMRRGVLAAVCVSTALAFAACATPVAYVPVREARFRSEKVTNNPIQVPLAPTDRDWLLAFLRAGGDKDRIGMEVVAPDAEARYGALLDLLSEDRNLSLESITEGDTFSAWFGHSFVRQVIDARADSPPAIDPVAVTDGTYWWIFTVRHKRLSSLLVEKAVPVDRPR